MYKRRIIILISIIALCLALIACTEFNYTVTNPSATDQNKLIHTEYPTITPVNTFEITQYYVTNNGIRIYEESQTNSKILAVLSCNDIVKLIDLGEKFCYVNHDNISGYICTDSLSPFPASQNIPQDISSYTFSDPHIIIIKSLHIMELWDGNMLLGSYPIDIGKNEVGRKEKLGDKKTPEGEYYICNINTNSKYYKTLFISYPNENDAKIALDAGLISKGVYNSIASAIEDKRQPPLKTPLGGYISIHGNPDEQGYTDGCIAVENYVIDILLEQFPLGSKVMILP